MIRLISFFTTIFISLSLHSGEKGKAWDTWVSFEKFVKAQDYNAAIKFTSGTWVNDYKFTQSHISLLAWELNKNPVKFINEFKQGNDHILVLKSWISPISLTFSSTDGQLTISHWTAAELKPGEANKRVDSKTISIKIKLADIRLQLRLIGKAYRKHFDKRKERILPNSTELGIEAKSWLYTDPETGSRQKILAVEPGYRWTNSSRYPTAITSSTILGKHYAVFDNGEVRPFHRGYFPVIIENFKYSLKANKNQNELILKLGNADRDIRKKAKKEIEKVGYSIAPVLRSYIGHKDPEISMTVKDILKSLRVDGQFRHAVYELNKVPRSLTVSLGKYFIVETEKNFLAIKLLKHTRSFKKYKKVENYGAEYEVTAFSKDGKKLGTKKGEVFKDHKNRSNSMKYIGYEHTFVHWEMGDNIYFDAHALAITKTGYSDLSQVDVTSKGYAWLKKKRNIVSRKGPSIDIIVNPNFYSYQGNKRSLDEMERILMGIGSAMGGDVLVVVRVDSKAKQKMVEFLIQRMLKHNLINFKVEEYKPRVKANTPRSKDGPILTPVSIENVKEK